MQQRSQWRYHGLTALALAPALGIIAVLFGTSVFYGVSQSLGWLPFLEQRELSFDAYVHVLNGPAHRREFWTALGFSLWVSTVATLASALIALLLTLPLSGQAAGNRRLLTIINLDLAFPHLVWAIGLLLLLSQSGLISRLLTSVGLIERPAQFPVLVRDRFGLGIIIAYITKEVPFLLLILVSILRSQTQAYGDVAVTLGANRWQRVRYVTLPLVGPGLLAGSLLVFAFIFGAYEVPALLGVQFPEMIAVLALDFFRNPDLNARAEGMAISVLMALVVLAVVAVAARLRRQVR